MEKPVFSQNLFWDVDIAQVDIDNDAAFVVERVLMYGELEDWHAIRNYFSKQKLRDIALSIKELEPKALSFIALYTDTPIEQFASYEFTQLHPPHSIYWADYYKRVGWYTMLEDYKLT